MARIFFGFFTPLTISGFLKDGLCVSPAPTIYRREAPGRDADSGGVPAGVLARRYGGRCPDGQDYFHPAPAEYMCQYLKYIDRE